MARLLLNTVCDIEVLLSDGAGNLVPAVPESAVLVWFCKKGGVSTQLTGAQFDWAEVDAVRMPGLYRLTINATGVTAGVLDTLDTWVAYIQPFVGTPAFREYPIHAEVVPLKDWDALRRLRAWGGHNYRVFPATWDAVSGEIATATLKVYPTASDANADTNVLESRSLVATYDSGGKVLTYKQTG